MNKKQSAGHICFIIVVIILSGLCLFYLGMSLQVILHLYRDKVYVPKETPTPTKLLFDYLAHRPEPFFTQVMFWFWWPILLTGIYSLMRYSKYPIKCIRCFNMGIIVCWLLILFFLSMCLMFCVLMFVYPLADIGRPPSGTRIITLISYCMPVITLLLSLFWYFTLRKKSVKKQD